jgi:uncharacterized protein (UPF0262 family)
MASGQGDQRLQRVEFDEGSLAALSPEQDDERKVAIVDLVAANHFAPDGGPGGPYALKLAIVDGRLALDVGAAGYERRFLMSLSPLRGVIKDYFLICESYYAAVRNATAAQIEALDMGRRGLHNEGAMLLMERLKGKVEVDQVTARRLFTLICALHWRG